ncbi:MAG: hypothetical protein RL137_165 [Bacteroidota bacterium]|jgi:hypothetical protein
MSQHSHTSIFTTASGVLGGVAKAVTAKPLLSEITLPGLANVVIYAAASAAAGYFVKQFMDSVARRFNNYFNKSEKK